MAKAPVAPAFNGVVFPAGTLIALPANDVEFVAAFTKVTTDTGVEYFNSSRIVVIQDDQGLGVFLPSLGADGSEDTMEFDVHSLHRMPNTPATMAIVSEVDADGGYNFVMIGDAIEYSIVGDEAFDCAYPEADVVAGNDDSEEVVEEADEVVETVAPVRGRGRSAPAAAVAPVKEKTTIVYDEIPEDEPTDEELGLPKKDAGRPSQAKVEARRAARAAALEKYMAKQAKPAGRSAGRPAAAPARSVRPAPTAPSRFRR